MTADDRSTADASAEPDEPVTETAVTETAVTETASPTPAPPRRRTTPVVRGIRGLSQAAYAGIVVLVIVVLVLAAMVLNPGERVGPVRPADPPVGGPGLPATRL